MPAPPMSKSTVGVLHQLSRDGSVKNNFEKLFAVEEALHYDAAALLPGLDAAVVLGKTR